MAGKLQNTPSGVNLLLVMELTEFSGTGIFWCTIAVLPIMLKLYLKKSSQSHVMNCIRLQIMQRNCLHCIYLKDHKPLKFTTCVEGHAYFAILHTFRKYIYKRYTIFFVVTQLNTIHSA